MATRLTLNQGRIRREVYQHFCPTCGRTRIRDGRMGGRNYAHFCSPDCYSRWKPYQNMRQALRAGSPITDAFQIPSPPGDN